MCYTLLPYTIHSVLYSTLLHYTTISFHLVVRSCPRIWRPLLRKKKNGEGSKGGGRTRRRGEGGGRKAEGEEKEEKGEKGGKGGKGGKGEKGKGTGTGEPNREP
jgi:hypothetical protein